MNMTSRIVFQQELEKLNGEVNGMAQAAKEAIEMAVRSIASRETQLIENVERLDQEIYGYDQVIERHCLDIIALHTPVAGDLRTISSCLKIITDLNRIGRYARDIAEISSDLGAKNGFGRMVNLTHMGELVTRMVADSINSFIDRDASAARNLYERDDEIDALYNSVFRETLTYMMEDPSTITDGTRYILAARYLERIADHSCNIGERVVYMVTGERMDPKGRSRTQSRLDGGTADPGWGRSMHELEEK
jgi:phosphate transport system protein